jgi:hypothetical protein
MANFRDIITNFSIGALSKSKLGFYAKRLAKETATRRLASVLMIGLMLLQFATFLAPPKPSYASSPGDLVPGGPFTKSSLITTVWDQNPQGIQQVFNRLQITRTKMQQAGTAQVCKGQGWLSMGRNADAGSTQWQPGIYIGPAESRWAQNCFNVLRGTSTIQDTQTGKWYEWGVILECGNIILKEVQPPQANISCTRLDTSNPGPVPVGTTVQFQGRARGTNITAGQQVGMSYAVYSPDGSPLGEVVDGPKRALGIDDSPAGSGTYVDPSQRPFTFNTPGTFIVRLAVTFDGGLIAPGSFVDSCAKQIVVQSPRTLACDSLTIQSAMGRAPFTPELTGKAIIEGNGGTAPTVSKYEYTLFKLDPNGTVTYDSGAKKYSPIPGKVITHNVTGLQDPAPPATSFQATDFKQTEVGEYLVRLIVYDGAGNPAPNKVACKKPFTVTDVDKSFRCDSLTADPTNGTAVPFTTNFNATAQTQNTTIKEYQFDFGDGNKQTVQSSSLGESLDHTYTSVGTFTATVKVAVTDDTTSESDTCSVTITVGEEPPPPPPPPSEQIPSKVVSNLTLLTTDGKPTDANNQTARAGDKLKYEIGIAHFGEESLKGYVFKDDISDLLQYSDVVDLGGGSVQQINGRTVIVWPAVDIPVSTDRNNPNFVSKAFTVQIKNPLPTNAQKPTDKTNYDCKMDDEFLGKLVSTPLYINPAKQVECLAVTIPVLATLPSTGSEIIPLIIIGLFAAASVYLFFRNRLLKRELELVEVLNDGVQING